MPEPSTATADAPPAEEPPKPAKKARGKTAPVQQQPAATADAPPGPEEALEQVQASASGAVAAVEDVGPAVSIADVCIVNTRDRAEEVGGRSRSRAAITC